MLQTKWIRRSVIAAVIAQVLCVGAVRADEFDDLRAKWAARGGVVDQSDPDVASQIATTQSVAQSNWDAMIRTADRTALWTDIADFTNSGNITNNFKRLLTLADAYYNGNQALRGNADVLQAVKDGIAFIVGNYYNVSSVQYGNWYDWQIGSTLALNSLMVTLYNDLSAQQLSDWIAVIDRFVPDPTQRLNADGSGRVTYETGANRLDKAFVVVIRGMLGKNSAKIAQGRDAISQALAFVKSGDGFYADGGFVQHTHERYVGAYGGTLLSDVSRLYYLLNNTSWAVTDPNKSNVYSWMMDAFRPFIYDGAMMDMQRGRQYVRPGFSDHVTGRSLMGNMLGLTDSLPADQSAQIKSVLKGWMLRDTSFGEGYFAFDPTVGGVAMGDITRLKNILNDPSIEPAAETQETRMFASVDAAVQRRSGYAYGVSMFSNRMSAYESGNGENLQGWWTGVGMTYLYNTDQSQYGGSYWATIDKQRLAGITTDHSGSTVPGNFAFLANTQSAVGGAELNKQFAALGMDFTMANVTQSTLAGKKAWFMLGDKIVAVGSGITASDGRSVETIVENRKLNEFAGNPLMINGQYQEAVAPWEGTFPGASWAHFAGDMDGSEISYIFPDAPVLHGLRESRVDSWSSVTSGGSTEPVVDNYLSLSLDHGVNPTNAAYTYIVLPNKSLDETAAYAANPGITVLERSLAATAVTDTVQGVTGALFWSDLGATVNSGGKALLTSDKKAAVVMQQNGNDLQVSVADMTQANTGNINLEINRNGGAAVSLGPGVSVVQLSPTIKLKYAVKSSGGKSLSARITLSDKISLISTDDSFVRDGSYASTNYGTQTLVTVKADGAGFARKGLVRFDLSSVQGTIVAASLRMTPTYVGMGNVTHDLYQVDAGWTEGTVTWNNRPANGSLVTSWVVPAVNTQVQADVTSAAVSAMAGSKLLAFDVEAHQNYGSAGQVDYASRQHTNTAYRPTLVLTIQ